MKYLVCIAVAVLTLMTTAYASPNSAVTNEANRQLDEIDTTEWDNFINGLSDEYSGIIELKPLKETVSDIILGQGETTDLFQIIIRSFTKNVPVAIAMLVKVFVLGVICGLLERLEGSFGSEGVSDIAKFVVFALAGIILFQILKGAVDDAVTAIDRMLSFMEIILPILMIFLTSMGAIASAGIIQPISGVLFGVVGIAIKNLVVPITLSGAAVSVVNNLSPSIKLNKLAELLKSVVQWILGLVTTVFSAVLSIKGLTAKSHDGVLWRTAKFTVSGLPIIGGMLGESADMVVGCALLVKNAVGIAGLSIIVMVTAAPCIRLLVTVLALRGCAAVLQPISNGGIAEIISDISGWIMMLFVSVGVCGLMMFLTLSLAIAMGDASVVR